MGRPARERGSPETNCKLAENAENNVTLLERLTNEQLPAANRAPELPATTSDEPKEPSLPVEQREEPGEGRKPEEVLEDREVQTRQKPKEAKPEAPAPRKVKVGDKELTLTDEQIKNLLTTAAQLPNLQQKYQELLEKNQRLPVPTEEAAPPPARITQDQIRQNYMAMLKETVAQGYMEEDFGDAYPNTATGLMYFRDIIEGMAAAFTKQEETMKHVVNWIGAEVDMRNARQVNEKLNGAIEATAEKPGKFYQGLKKPETRAEFVNWLRKEVDPKVGTITPEYIDKQWLAFNAAEVLEFVEANKETEPTRKRAAGDGTGARHGTRETPEPKTLLDRMSDLSGKFADDHG